MPDEIEVSTEPEKKDEPPVSFVESEGETHVTIGEEKTSDGATKSEDERWREAEARQNRLAEDFADLRSRLTGPVQAPQVSPSSDPWKAEEDGISEQERALGIQWEAHKANRTLTADLLKDFDQKSRALSQRRHDIAAQRAIRNALPAFIQASEEQRYRTQYSDVRGNQAANRWARGHYDMLVASGAPESPETVDRAMNAARVQFRLPGARQQPTEQDRQQLMGFSGTGRKSMEPKNNTVKMGKSEKIMAMAMYGDRFNGDEKKTYSQWARGPGIRAQKAAQKARAAQR